MITILSVTQLSPTAIRLTTTEMLQDVGYNVTVSNVTSVTGHLIDLSQDNADYSGLGIKPKVISAVALDSSHIDIEFDEQMENGSALAYWNNYTLSGSSTYNISSAVLDPDGVTVHLTLAHKMYNGAHTLTVYSVPDSAGNPTDPNNCSAAFSYTYSYPVNDMVMAPTTSYTSGSVIEIRAMGVVFDSVYPIVNLKIDDVTVETWAVSGNYIQRYVQEGLYYLYPGHVTPDQVKVELTNPIAGNPNEVGLTYWALDPASTAILSNEYYNYITYSARVTLTAPSASPSDYNSAIQSLGTVTADKALTASAKMLAPVGVQGRMELWVFPAGPGALLSAADFAGTGEWIDAELTAVTPTGIQLEPELRLITNSPNVAGSYVDWTDVYVEQDHISNPDFTPIVDPWYTNTDSRLSVTLLSEPAGTYARGTIVKDIEPEARVYHAMAYDDVNNISIMFGGWLLGGYTDDTYEWNDSTGKWAEVSPTGGVQPDSRGRYSFAFDSNRAVFVLFGGSDGLSLFDDVWEYNAATSTWVQTHAGGGGGVTNPTPRYSAACAFDSARNKTLIFGGYNGSTFYSDLWEYDGGTATWSLVAPVTSTPTARYYSTMVYDNSRNLFVLFGGLTATTRSDETWEYNAAARSWAQIAPVGGVKPSGRSEHGMVYDSSRSVCVMFAGQDGIGSVHICDDTWEYDGALSTWTLVEPGGGGGVTNPDAIVAFSMAYDSTTQNAVIFGGYEGSTFIANIWDYTCATATYTEITFNANPSGWSVDHLNSLCQNLGSVGYYTRCTVSLKIRAPVGTISRVVLYILPWVGALSTYIDHYGTGDWEDVEIYPIYTDGSHDSLIVRLVTYYPDQNGIYAEWKNVSVKSNLIQNSNFQPRTLVLDKLVVDGYAFKAFGNAVYSTGTWLPGDGPSLVPGYRESEKLNGAGEFDFGAEVDDDYIADADSRIETYRKGNGTLTVRDTHGHLLSGVTVDVEQTNHTFIFGSVWQQIVFWKTDPLYTAKVQAYEDKFAALFNLGTAGCFWNDYSNPSDGNYSTALMDFYVALNTTYDLYSKAVALMYNIYEPTYVHEMSGADAAIRQLAYINFMVSVFTGVVDYWEVADETAICENAGFYAATPGLTRAYKLYTRETMIYDAFSVARLSNPAAILSINDYHADEAYFSLLEKLLAKGSSIDAVKIQSHMDADVWSNQQIWQVTNRLGSLIPDVRFSEISIFSGIPYTLGGVRRTRSNQTLVSWATTTEGEDQQAIEVERFYKMAFSCPYVNELTWWNLTDWYAWYYESTPSATEIARGLIRSDMSNKPAYDVLQNLIYNEWWTITSGYTDSNGEFSYRGFAGEYDITLHKTGYVSKTISVDLSTAGSNWSTTLSSV